MDRKSKVPQETEIDISEQIPCKVDDPNQPKFPGAMLRTFLNFRPKNQTVLHPVSGKESTL